MSKHEFQQFLDNTPNPQSEKDFKDTQLKEWRDYLDSLYKSIVDEWMKDFIKKSEVTYRFREITIFEEFSGEYPSRELWLNIKNQTVQFIPIGTMLIGAKGRVDIQGKNGKTSFILVDRKLTGPNIQVNVFTSDKEREDFEKKQKSLKPEPILWTWKILNNKNGIRYIDLNEETFFDVLMSLING
ncbi:MAG: hypothetical protein JXR62_01865 [Bacilli bacterium]|nr:hypothetical protein [Bacilli bacterium]